MLQGEASGLPGASLNIDTKAIRLHKERNK